MKHVKSNMVLDRLVSPLGDCLTPESARRILALKADPELQAHIDDLAARRSEGKLTPEEQAEYGRYVSFSTFDFFQFSSVGRADPADISVCADYSRFDDGDVFVPEAGNELTRR